MAGVSSVVNLVIFVHIRIVYSPYLLANIANGMLNIIKSVVQLIQTMHISALFSSVVTLVSL